MKHTIKTALACWATGPLAAACQGKLKDNGICVARCHGGCLCSWLTRTLDEGRRPGWTTNPLKGLLSPQYHCARWQRAPYSIWHAHGSDVCEGVLLGKRDTHAFGDGLAAYIMVFLGPPQGC